MKRRNAVLVLMPLAVVALPIILPSSACGGRTESVVPTDGGAGAPTATGGGTTGGNGVGGNSAGGNNAGGASGPGIGGTSTTGGGAAGGPSGTGAGGGNGGSGGSGASGGIGGSGGSGASGGIGGSGGSTTGGGAVGGAGGGGMGGAGGAPGMCAPTCFAPVRTVRFFSSIADVYSVVIGIWKSCAPFTSHVDAPTDSIGAEFVAPPPGGRGEMYYLVEGPAGRPVRGSGSAYRRTYDVEQIGTQFQLNLYGPLDSSAGIVDAYTCPEQLEIRTGMVRTFARFP